MKEEKIKLNSIEINEPDLEFATGGRSHGERVFLEDPKTTIKAINKLQKSEIATGIVNKVTGAAVDAAGAVANCYFTLAMFKGMPSSGSTGKK